MKHTEPGVFVQGGHVDRGRKRPGAVKTLVCAMSACEKAGQSDKQTVSYAQLQERLDQHLGKVEHTGLFINHTLWNRTNDAILVPGIARNGTRQMFVIRVEVRR